MRHSWPMRNGSSMSPQAPGRRVSGAPPARPRRPARAGAVSRRRGPASCCVLSRACGTTKRRAREGGLVRSIVEHAKLIGPNVEHINQTGGVVAGALPLLYGMAEEIVVGATWTPQEGAREPAGRPRAGAARACRTRLVTRRPASTHDDRRPGVIAKPEHPVERVQACDLGGGDEVVAVVEQADISGKRRRVQPTGCVLAGCQRLGQEAAGRQLPLQGPDVAAGREFRDPFTIEVIDVVTGITGFGGGKHRAVLGGRTAWDHIEPHLDAVQRLLILIPPVDKLLVHARLALVDRLSAGADAGVAPRQDGYRGVAAAARRRPRLSSGCRSAAARPATARPAVSAARPLRRMRVTCPSRSGRAPAPATGADRPRSPAGTCRRLRRRKRPWTDRRNPSRIPRSPLGRTR